jgi:site-specific recombinase XerD
LNDNQKVVTISEFYERLIKEFKEEGRISTAEAYRGSYSTLKRFTGKRLDIPFSDIDVLFLREYEKWLRKNNFAETSMWAMFKMLRSAYNKAIEAKCTRKTTAYPFDEYKVSKFDITTQKRAIPKEAIKKVMEVDLSKESFYIQLSRDIFIFSYLCGGINFTDIANLKLQNLVDGSKLMFVRKKSKKKINTPLSIEALLIINKYAANKTNPDDYIFPVLDDKVHKTEIKKHYRIHRVLSKVNLSLKTVAKSAGINVNLTTYVARHSFATVLKNSGVNIALISEILGHSDLATTQIYLDSFESEQIGEALKHLL